LLNTLFVVDPDNPLFAERTKAYINCSKRALQIRLLLDRKMRDLAIELAEDTLPNKPEI
jgi:hypothetical protein